MDNGLYNDIDDPSALLSDKTLYWNGEHNQLLGGN